MKTNELYQKITDEIVKLLKKQLAGGGQSWINLKGNCLPHNLTTAKNYSGINTLILSIYSSLKKYEHNGWLTFNQARKLNAKVKPGAKSAPVYYFTFVYKDSKGKTIPPAKIATMTKAEISVLDAYGIIKSYAVFNAAQVEGLPKNLTSNNLEITLNDFEQDQQAESILNNSTATIYIKKSNEAFYSPNEDIIVLPLREQFPKNMKFYEVAFHELSHWTAHESRLNRPIKNKFGSAAYAKEELIAELGAAFLMAEIGCEKLITDNAAYIQSWLSVLNNDPKIVISAAAKAQKAANYILMKSLQAA